MQLNDRELGLVANALRVAAEQYDNDAAMIRWGRQRFMAVTHDRLAEQFARQARDARALAKRIEDQA
jgi:hypothetical protein